MREDPFSFTFSNGFFQKMLCENGRIERFESCGGLPRLELRRAVSDAYLAAMSGEAVRPFATR
jgi:hypothetical protein